MIEGFIQVDGQVWRFKGQSTAAVENEISNARVTGSVGSRTVVDKRLVGGTEELLAEVHKIDADGKDVQPS